MPLTLQRIADRQAVVGVVGLGYVGLPLALCFAEGGLKVVGFDIDPTKISRLDQRRSYLNHIADTRIAAVAGRLVATTDFRRVSEVDAVIICVPTPLGPHWEPDLRFIEDTCRAIAPHLAAGTLVVLESTTWPGTTIEVVRPLLEAGSPRRLGLDLYIGFSPEREDPGNAHHNTRTIPKLVSGMDDASKTLAEALYRVAVEQVVPLGDTRVAECAKLFENIFRSVNIALVNEMKIVLDRMGIDVYEVIRAAATKPFGFMPFWPGPGLGGHCIPIDPFYLTWKAKEFGVQTRFIELAGEINRRMPGYVVDKLRECLNRHGRPVQGSRVLVLGLAYKADVDDMRESPSLEIMDLIEEQGGLASYHDPFLPEIPPNREHAHLVGRRSQEPSADFDCLLLATAHRVYHHLDLLAFGQPIVDTRHLLPDHPLVCRA